MPITTGQITIASFQNIFREMIREKQAAGIEPTQNNPDDLMERAKAYGVQYKNGSWGWGSNIWHRSEANTEVVASEHELKPYHRQLMLRVLEHIQGRPLIQIDANLGSPGSPAEMHCRLYCDPQYPDIAHRWQQLCFPADPNEKPDAELFFIPQYLQNPPIPGKPETILQVIRFPNHNYTICTGSSYQGEVKKAFLSHWILHCYNRGGTGEHAGLKEFTVKMTDGSEKRVVMGVWGLTGSGKSTHALYIFNEETNPIFRERFGIDFSDIVYDQAIKNDDIIGWFEDKAYGSEQGAWTKTERVGRHQQAIYRAGMSPHALHENTEWDEDGEVSFEGKRFQYHGELNQNARTVLRLEDTGYFDGSVDSTAPPNAMVFISPGYTNDYAWLKINDIDFAAKVLADGRTVGHPAQSKVGVGETKYCSRYCLPFTMGVGNAEHVHRLRDFMLKRANAGDPIEVYQINTTGKIGAKYEWHTMTLDGQEYAVPRAIFQMRHGKKQPAGGTDPAIEETELFLIQVVRGAVEYAPHPLWGEKVLVPTRVPGISQERLAQFNPYTYHTNEEMEMLLEAQVSLSKYYLNQQCPGLDRDIYYAMDF